MKGYETFFQTIKSNLKDPVDLIVSVVHLILIQDFDLKCIVSDDQWKNEYENITGSELLPIGWNNNNNQNYNLIYQQNGDKTRILLNCSIDHQNDNNVINVKFSNITTNNENYQFKIDKNKFLIIDSNNDDDWKNFNKFNNEKINELATFIRENMKNFYQNKKFIASTSNNPNNQNNPSNDDQSNVPFSKFIPSQAQPSRLLEDDPNRLIYPPIGSGDLDPFGRMGGGMIFDPFSGNRFRPERGPPMNIPRGAVPPGARYDPVGPLPDARFFKPDPDHFPPPRGPGFGGGSGGFGGFI